MSPLSAQVMTYVVPVIIAMVMLTIEPCGAIVGRWDHNTDDRIVLITDFSFEKGGQWHMEVDPSFKGVALELLICTLDDWDDHFSWDGGSDRDALKACGKLANNRTKCDHIPFRGFLNITRSVHKKDIYVWGLLNCNTNQTKFSRDYYYELINPGGEHLGWDVLPLPYMYAVLILVYFLLMIFWLINIVLNQMGQGSNRLHMYLSFWPVIKLFLVSFNTGFWEDLSSNGATSWATMATYCIYNAFWSVYLFSALLAISLGWGISRKGISWLEAIVVAISLIVLYVTEILNYSVEGIALIGSMCVWGCLLLFMLIFFRANIKGGKQQLSQLSSQRSSLSVPPTSSNAQDDRHVVVVPDLRYQKSQFTLLQRLYVLRISEITHSLYTGLLMTWAALYIIFFMNYVYILRVLNEIIELCLFISLMYLFRLQLNNLYYEFNDDALLDWERNKSAQSSSAPAQPSTSAVHSSSKECEEPVLIEMDNLPPQNVRNDLENEADTASEYTERSEFSERSDSQMSITTKSQDTETW